MPIVGRFDTKSVNNSSKSTTSKSVEFPCQYIAPPRLPHGFSCLDVGTVQRDICARATITDIQNGSAVYRVTTWNNTILENAIVSSLNLAPADVDFLTGEHCLTSTDHVPPLQAASVRINFERRFITCPKVVVFFNLLDIAYPYHGQPHPNARVRLSITASEIDPGGFSLTFEWSDATILRRCQACWIAYPADREHIISASVNIINLPRALPERPQVKYNQAIYFSNDVAFWKIPNVFVALNMLEFDWKERLRINAYVDGVTMSGLTCHVETEADNCLRCVGATVIAVN